MSNALRLVLPMVLLAGSAAAQDTTMVQGGIYQRPFIVESGRTAVGGYAEGSASYFRTDGVGDGLSMELRRFNIFLFSGVGRRIRFISELEFEHGTEEIALETALLDFVVNPSLVLRAGILLPPIGAFNVNHDSPRYEFVDRPLVSTRVIPATLSEVGFGVHGRLAPGAVDLSYDLYLTNGLGPGVVLNGEGRTDLPSGKSEERFAEDNNGSPAVSGRIGLHAPGVGEAGLSYYGGVYNDHRVEGVRIDDARWVHLLALDWGTELGRLKISGEAAAARIDVAPELRELFATRQWGVYLDLVLPVWRPRIRALRRPEVSLAARVEHVDLNAGSFSSTGLGAGDEITALTFGASFRPVSGTVARVNYRAEWGRDLLRNPTSRTAGIQVGFATYF